MEFEPQAWYWFVIGIALILFELVIPILAALWFGAGAVAVGVLVWLVPATPLEYQVALWIILSVALVLFWFKYLKPRALDRTMAGMPREALIGQVGTVATPLLAGHTCIVRFPMPVMGSDEWSCRSEQELVVGDRVKVIDVLGNELVVSRYFA